MRLSRRCVAHWNCVCACRTGLGVSLFLSVGGFAFLSAAHSGVIVNVVANMHQGFPGMVHTGAARAGVVNLTKTLAVEWGHHGVCPFFSHLFLFLLCLPVDHVCEGFAPLFSYPPPC